MHDRFVLLMSLVLDNEATPIQAAELADHLLHCPACACLWTRLAELDRRLTEAPLVVPPPGFVARVMARLPRRRPSIRWRWIGPTLALVWLSMLAVQAGLAVTGA